MKRTGSIVSGVALIVLLFLAVDVNVPTYSETLQSVNSSGIASFQGEGGITSEANFVDDPGTSSESGIPQDPTIVALTTNSDPSSTNSPAGSSDASTSSASNAAGALGTTGNGTSVGSGMGTSDSTGTTDNSQNSGEQGLPSETGDPPSDVPQSLPEEFQSSSDSTNSLPSNDTSSTEAGVGDSDQVSTATNQSEVEPTLNDDGASETDTGSEVGTTSSTSKAGSDNGNLQTASTSSFEVAALTDQNGVTRPIETGDGQGINIGDVSNTGNVSATASFDRTSYAVGDTVQITVEDNDGNIDPDTVNTVEITIRSDSDQIGIKVTLTESGPNTGQFVGDFQLTDSASTSTSIKVDPSSGDRIQLLYDSSHPRAQVTLNEVSSPGTAELTETRVTSVNDGGDFSEVLVGNAVELTLVDGAQLAPNEATDFCLTQFAQPVTTCGGHITMTLSYANAPLNNQIPSELTMFQKVGGTWLNLKEFGEVIVDENAKTVTVVTPFGPGIFTIGASIGGGGGGGGGIGLPGAGIVLDFVAEVSAPPPSEPPSSSPPTSGSDTSSPPEPSEIATPSSSSTSDGNTTSSSGQLQGSQSSSSQSQGAAQQDKSNARTGNVTIKVPGEGTVLLSYQKLLSEGNLTATPVKDMAEIMTLDVIKKTAEQRGILSTSNNTNFNIIGTIFKIGPSDARFNETVTVSIPYDSKATAGKEGTDIRILQHSGNNWEDVTILPEADGQHVTGSISSLGPVVAAIKSG